MSAVKRLAIAGLVGGVAGIALIGAIVEWYLPSIGY